MAKQYTSIGLSKVTTTRSDAAEQDPLLKTRKSDGRFIHDALCFILSQLDDTSKYEHQRGKLILPNCPRKHRNFSDLNDAAFTQFPRLNCYCYYEYDVKYSYTNELFGTTMAPSLARALSVINFQNGHTSMEYSIVFQGLGVQHLDHFSRGIPNHKDPAEDYYTSGPRLVRPW